MRSRITPLVEIGLGGRFWMREWKRMLRDYEAPILDQSTDEHLQTFMTKRKEAMPDIWY